MKIVVRNNISSKLKNPAYETATILIPTVVNYAPTSKSGWREIKNNGIVT